MLIRSERRGADVLVTVDGDPVDWRASLALRSHSPPGPAWGYGGSGPAQLALAILLALTDVRSIEVLEVLRERHDRAWKARLGW